MNLSNLIDRLNNELDKLNNLKNQGIDTSSFFTNNEHFNDDHDEYLKRLENNSKDNPNQSENISMDSNIAVTQNNYENIKPDNETKWLVETKPNYLLTAQTMFKRTIKFSLKSFLISISLSFLNLFV